MKYFLLFILIAFSAYASDDCKSLLSVRVTISIHDLAKLRYDLDSKIASGESSTLIRALENSFSRKKSEILAVSTLSLLAFDQVLKDEVSNLQSLEDRKNAENTANHQTQKVAVDQSSIGISVVGRMNKIRTGHQVSTLPDDRVLIFGGKHGDSDLVEEVEIYDPKTQQFETIGKLLEPRIKPHHIVMADGRILLWGGEAKVYLDSVEIIDPVLKTVSPGGFKFRARGPITRLSDVEFLQWAEFKDWQIVNVEENTVRDLEGYTTNGLVFSALKNGDLIYAKKKKWKRFDFSQGLTVEVGVSREHREQHAQVTLLDDQILLSGGVTTKKGIEKVSRSIEEFNPSTGKSELVGNLVYARSSHRMMVIPDGRVVVLGGYDNGQVRWIEMIELNTGISTVIGEMQYLDASSPTTVLSNGDILVVGANGTDLIERIKVGKRE